MHVVNRGIFGRKINIVVDKKHLRIVSMYLLHTAYINIDDSGRYCSHSLKNIIMARSNVLFSLNEKCLLLPVYTTTNTTISVSFSTLTMSC